MRESSELDADPRRRERLAELRDLGADLVQLVASSATESTWSIHAAIGSMSFSRMPRDVIDGVPMRRPDGSNGLRGSNGIVL